MPNTLIPIQTYTLSSSAASVTFSNIPQNYTDLKVVISGRDSSSDGTSDAGYSFTILPNGLNTSISQRSLFGSGSAAISYTDTQMYNPIAMSADTASTYSNVEIYVPNYTSTNFKSFSIDGITERNATGASIRLSAGLWSSTAAITSLQLTALSTWVANSTFTLYGISNGVKATGGTLTVAGGYAYHTFTSTGSFLPSQQIKGAEVLTIAGGGSGGEGNTGYWQVGGGGGAGGVVYSNALNLTAGTTYTATVGAGGTRVSSRHGVQGNNSQFGPLTSAIGGGYGGAMSGIGGSLGPGGNGGSGGGNEGYNIWSRSTGSQGFGGGLGVNDQDRGGAGGGGGAGGQGGDGSGTTGGNGGSGTNTYLAWATVTGTGVNGFYAGGGAGSGSASGGSNGSGGSGGGGAPGVAGTANTGSGSGGTRSGNAVANGGSGIIIVRYPIP